MRQLRLPERVRQHQGEFVVWDIGLGAAANPLSVLRASRGLPCHIRVVSFDQTLEPLQFALSHSAAFPYLEGYESRLASFLVSPRAGISFSDGAQVVDWSLKLGDFPAFLGSPAAEPLPKPHAILFDAYSPAANPAMWTQPLFARLYQLLGRNRPCALPTYSRSTMLRVTLLLAGFFVGKGHATGEKEETTIAANTPTLIENPLDRRWLDRARHSTSAEPLWEPVYRQAPISEKTWERLRQHPQFR